MNGLLPSSSTNHRILMFTNIYVVMLNRLLLSNRTNHWTLMLTHVCSHGKWVVNIKLYKSLDPNVYPYVCSHSNWAVIIKSYKSLGPTVYLYVHM